MACWLLLAALGAGLGCGLRTGIPSYDFSDPYSVHELPADLEELSGLVVLQSKYVTGVSDEHGAYYTIDFTNGRVVERQVFGEAGHYEDLVRIGPSLFILEENGTLHRIRSVRSRHLTVEQIRTTLTSDAEGLAYDRANGRLLISGIEQAGPGGRPVGAIYTFDLRTGTTSEGPLYTIPMDSVRQALGDADAALAGLEGPFRPNALALHPRTGHLYVASAKARMILVLGKRGEILAAYPLPEHLFPEPEGLTFRSSGDLFVANEESGGRPATILRFKEERFF